MNDAITNALDDVVDVLRSPLGLLAVTLIGYQLGRKLQNRLGGHAIAQPVLVAIVIVGAWITLLDVEYDDYVSATQMIAFWLGPATVALAVPLHRQAGRLTGFVVPMLVAVVVGAAVSIVSAVLIARALGADDRLEKTLTAKSATTPVAIAVTDAVGGIAPVAAVLVILIGVFGAVVGPATLNLLRIRDRRARGLAVGAVSHGVGASRMLQEDETEGAFAGLSMGLSALAISILVPLLAVVLF
ncbi:LrgB family protein [Nocardioides sp. J54]|uniref:LrgB family protein n=1 Tax=Nocardioides sp. J54 TaxID=935866 RepID=UPI0004AE2102|nr:LrgB family protein [Nocardioides sp. J54]